MSHCKFGNHSRHRWPLYWHTLHKVIFDADLRLSRELWVNGQAARIVKRRLRSLLRHIDTHGGKQYREKPSTILT